ncbi:ABC-F family ATP-binding cassette domain-containing protein [Jatrophihabitans sp. YIM 134969]
MSTPAPAVVVTDLGFSWPDGSPVLSGFSTTIGAGRSGLVGVNGSGKSTLLRLIAGELTAATGSVAVHGRLGYVPQRPPAGTGDSVARVLGVEAALTALRAIEAGDASERHFAAVGDDWDVEERARATLDRLGLTAIELDRCTQQLSGGEAVLLRLAAELLRAPDVLLLDEPTNNLDTEARERLYAAVRGWAGTLVVVTHDRELLGLVDRIGDLRDGAVRWYGGAWDDYRAAVAAEQETAERQVRAAEDDVRRQEHELAAARVALDRRARYGQKMWDTKREPKIVMGARKRDAQVSAGKHRTLHSGKVDEARARLREREDAVRDDPSIRVDLPDSEVPAGRTVLTLRGLVTRAGPVPDLDVFGPARVAVTGPNGAGKTTLLDTVVGRLAPVAGEARVAVPWRYLPQRLDVLDPDRSVVENVAAVAPEATVQQIRDRLARFRFRGAAAEARAGTLSGGERFRAALAALLLAQPTPQLLVLDEPTNNLDLASVAALTDALHAHRGALLVVSHDRAFLDDLALTREISLDPPETPGVLASL